MGNLQTVELRQKLRKYKRIIESSDQPSECGSKCLYHDAEGYVICLNECVSDYDSNPFYNDTVAQPPTDAN